MSINKENLMTYANNLFNNAISLNKLNVIPSIEHAKSLLSENKVAYGEILKILNNVSNQLKNSIQFK